MDPVFAATARKVTIDDDLQYCVDLGLVVLDENRRLRPANAIYNEVTNRVITDKIQDSFEDVVPKMEWTDVKNYLLAIY